MKIAVVGAGIMGRTLGFALVNAGHNVSIFDKDDAMSASNCSMTAAGMLAPIAELITSGLMIYQMGMEALQTHWPQLLASLDETIYFRKMGSVVVAHPKDTAELTHFINMLDSKRVQTSHYQLLDQNTLIKLEPALDKFSHAYYLQNEGQLDSQAVMQALYKALQQANVTWLVNTEVMAIHANKVVTKNGENEFDIVFDCRGLGAQTTFADLQAVRGELIWLHAPDVNLQRPIRLMHPRYNLYVVPRPEHTFIIGASEIYAEDYSEISVRSSLELLTAAYYLHPAFAEARIIKTVTHCRPALADHMPKIKCQGDNMAINGLYRHGYLIAPVLVAEIMRYLQHGVSSLQYSSLWEFA